MVIGLIPVTTVDILGVKLNHILDTLIMWKLNPTVMVPIPKFNTASGVIIAVLCLRKLVQQILVKVLLVSPAELLLRQLDIVMVLYNIHQ
jgi:hypothetical protein